MSKLRRMKKSRYNNAYAIIIFLILFLLGIVLIYISTSSKNVWLYTISIALGGTIISTSFFAIFNFFFEKRASIEYIEEILDEKKKTVGLIKKIDDCGLIDILYSFPFESEININETLFKLIREDFTKSKNVIMVYNHGAGIFRSDIFRGRLEKYNKRFNKIVTKVFILNYKNENLMAIYNKKNGHKDGHYEDKLGIKLKDKFKKLAAEFGENSFQVYLNDSFNDVSVVMTDHYVVMSGFYIHINEPTIPHYIFKKGSSEYDIICCDLMDLTEQSELQDWGESNES